METFLLYILKSAICLAVFYVCFKALFSNDTFFRFNRWLLLTGTLICMFLPLCRIQMGQPVFIQQPIDKLEMVFSGQEETEAGIMTEKVTVSPEKGREEVSWIQILWIGYLTGCVVCLGTTLISFRKIQELIRQGKQIQAGNYKLVTIPVSIAPFSWNRYIFLSEEDYRNHPEEILAHEKMHLQYNHSVDLIYMEVVLLLQWFNPAVWLLKRELRDIHEYQADKGVLNQGIDATKYQLLLVKKAVGSSLYTLANSFNHSKIKKRITMMLRKKSNGWVRLKLALLVPVGLIALSVFASPPQEVGRIVQTSDNVQLPTSKSTENPKTVQQDTTVLTPYVAPQPKPLLFLIQDQQIKIVTNPAFEHLDERLANGTLSKVKTVYIEDGEVKVSKVDKERLKKYLEEKGYNCEIGAKGSTIAPPPPPPPPMGTVTVYYKNGKLTQQFTVYNHHTQSGKNLAQRIDKVYNDDIVKVEIAIKPKADPALQGKIQEALKNKIKYPVQYEVLRGSL